MYTVSAQGHTLVLAPVLQRDGRLQVLNAEPSQREEELRVTAPIGVAVSGTFRELR